MPTIFISYAHEDAQWRDEIESYLRILKLNNPDVSLVVWSDRQLQTGEDWKARIDATMEACRVALLIVTKDFLASEFIRNEELPYLVKRAETSDLQLFPIIAEPCPWEDVPTLRALQHRPGGGKALSAMSDNDLNEELTELYREISRSMGSQDSPTATTAAPSHRAETPSANDGRDGPTLQLSFRHRRSARYRVEAQYSDTAGGRPQSLQYNVSFADAPAGDCVTDPNRYAVELERRIFPPGVAQGLYSKVCELAGQRPLHLRISVDPTARDLHTVNWEALPAAAAVDLRVSRHLSQGDERWPKPSVRRWPKARLLLLDFSGRTDSTADLIGEHLSGLDVEPVPLPDNAPLTDLERTYAPVALLSAQFATGPDGISILWPDGNSGMMQKPIEEAVSDLRRHLRDSQVLILDPCEASATGDEAMLFAADIAAAGFSAVVTTAKPMDQQLWLGFLREFLAGLVASGNIDTAADRAKASVADVGERWKPAVFARLRTGQVWFRPRFIGGSDQSWDLITRRVEQGTVVPILGPRVSEFLLRSREEISRHLADRCQYPLDRSDRSDLRKVAQYVATTLEQDAVRDQFIEAVCTYAGDRYAKALPGVLETSNISQLLDLMWRSVFSKRPDDPYALLARLRAPIYFTAPFHNFLSLAIDQHAPESAPRDRIFSLDRGILNSDRDGDDQNQLIDRDHPLVYYLFGRVDYPKSLVLTEDDHFRFLLDFKEQWRSLPTEVINKFSDSALLFLGFDLDSWDFRTIFRAFLELEGSSQLRRIPHVAVQVVPDDDRLVDPVRAQQYLLEYFRQISEKPLLFLGSSHDFLTELDKRCQL